MIHTPIVKTALCVLLLTFGLSIQAQTAFDNAFYACKLAVEALSDGAGSQTGMREAEDMLRATKWSSMMLYRPDKKKDLDIGKHLVFNERYFKEVADGHIVKKLAKEYYAEERGGDGVRLCTKVLKAKQTTTYQLSCIGNTSSEKAKETIEVGWAEDISFLQLSTIVGLLDSMMYVPAGTFVMGTDTPLDDEGPAHQETIAESFYIGKFEVKRSEWFAIMHNCEVTPDSACLPMNNISWEECQEFVNRLHELTSLHFSLPTEKQWEYAAKGAGAHTGEIPGDGTLDDVAWHKRNSYGKPHATYESKIETYKRAKMH